MKTIFTARKVVGILKNTAKDTFRQMNQAQLLLVASSLAYTTILSIIPLIAVSFAIFYAFGGMEKLYDTIEPFIISNLAEAASEEARAALQRFIGNAHASAIGLGGFFALVFTSMTMLYSIEKAINQVWRAPVSRNWFQRISTYWLFITIGPLALAVAVGAATNFQGGLTRIFPSGTGMFLLTIAVFFAIYKWVPHCYVHWPYALISGTFTAVLWNLARIAYALYTKRNVSYANIYGSLAAVPILLLWIYIIWVIVLTGAALTAALQKRVDKALES